MPKTVSIELLFFWIMKRCKLKDNQEAKIEIEKVLANKTDKNDELKACKMRLLKLIF